MTTLTKRIGVASWALAVVSASSALAHDGHGDPAWYGSALHYLIEPEHRIAIVLVAIAVCISVWRLRNNRIRSRDLS